MRRLDPKRAGRAVIGLALFAAALPGGASAQAAPDYDVSGGHFFTQTGGGTGKGYAVTDADGVAFWSAFQSLGGVEVVGYPVSQRFMHGGFMTQAMQKAVFQWRPESKSVAFVNVFDDLAAAGKDDFLLNARQTPKAQPFDDGGRPFDQVVKIRQAALDARPAMKAMYFNAKDPVLQYGLPTSQIQDMGNVFVIRMQRGVIQEWKQDVPWAKAGQATVANGGDIAKEAGLFPAPGLAPADAGATPAPAGAAPAPAAPASPPAPAPAPAAPAPAAPASPPAPAGGLVLKPNQIAPYDTPIAGDSIQPGRVNVIQSTKSKLGPGDRIVGLVRNDTGGPVYNLRIMVTGTDAKGSTSSRLITSGKTYRSFMDPGEVQPFEAQGSLVDAIRYNVSTSGTIAGTGLPAYRDLQVQVSGQSKNSAGWLVVQGTIVNPTGAWRRNVGVVAGGYDADGNLEDIGFSYTTPPDLAPGQSGRFAATLPANSAKVTDVRVTAEAYDRTLEISGPPEQTDHGGTPGSN